MSLWMNTGTIAVTLNNKKVTGTGTAFANSAIPARPGQPIVISNVIYEIESVESDTVLWLATNYLGASATGVKYSVMTTMEGSFNDLARRAAQVMGAYQVYMDVYNDLFTGTGNVTVTLPDGSTVILPAWNSMQPKDATLTAFAALVGSANKLPYFTNNDAFALANFTAFARNLLDDPDAATMRATLGLGTAATRTALGTKELYSRDSVVGVVSQVSGVPTGAVIESGSNSNGSFIKYADGTLFCLQTLVVGVGTLVQNRFGTTAGAGYRPNDSFWTFPHPFVAAPHTWASPVGLFDHGGGYTHLSNVTATQAARRVWMLLSGDYSISFFALGRWY